MELKVGDIIDIRVTKDAIMEYKSDPKRYELMLGFPNTHLSGLETADYIERLGKVIHTFGNVIRIELKYDKGRWEEDIHKKFIRRNKQDFREERLSNILNKEKK